MTRLYQPCSGQAWEGRKRQWGICAPAGPAWWRANDRRGRQRKFSTYRDAELAARKLDGEWAVILPETYAMLMEELSRAYLLNLNTEESTL